MWNVDFVAHSYRKLAMKRRKTGFAAKKAEENCLIKGEIGDIIQKITEIIHY